MSLNKYKWKSDYVLVYLKMYPSSTCLEKQMCLLCLWSFPTVPGAVPLESIQGSAYEEKIILKWREPAQTYGIIIQYEVHKHQLTDIDNPS